MGVRRCLTYVRKKGGSFTLGLVGALIVWPQLASSHHSFASVFTADGEEAIEVVLSASEVKQRTIEETADLLYHLLVFLNQREVALGEVLEELKNRHLSSDP